MAFAAIPGRVYAYQNLSYSRDIKIQLKSMSSSSMTVTLNGSYDLNGNVVPSGTVYTVKAENGRINMNGADYDQVRLTPQDYENTVTISNGGKTHDYLGIITLRPETGMVIPYNTVDIEDYLKGVVGNEMSESFPIEALKAQAVAARNYALSMLGACAAKGYDFDDTTTYQVYNGDNENYKNVIQAVEDTKGMVLLNNDSLVQAFYSASNGGYTEDAGNVWLGSLPYLVSKPDSFDSESWPGGTKTLSNAQIESILKSNGTLSAADKFVKLDLNSITRYPSGRVSKINVIYTDANKNVLTKSFIKENARTFLALPSSMYTVTYNSSTGSYVFTGKGNGHGVGMSQVGAKNRANSGQAYGDILGFYYDNTSLNDLIPDSSNAVFNESSSSIILGQNITFHGSPKNNGQTYLYKYVVSKDGNVVYTRDYSDNSLFEFKPDSTGLYNVSLLLKDPVSNEEYDSQQNVNFTVYTAPGITGFNAVKTSGTTGDTFKFASSASGGTGKYLYRYVIYANDGTAAYVRDYSPDSTFSYTPSVSGNYRAVLYLRDAQSENPYDDTQTSNVYATEVNQPQAPKVVLPEVKVAVQPASEYKPGDMISFEVRSPNYTGKVQYRVVLNNWVAKKTTELWPSSPGYYYTGEEPGGNYYFPIHWSAKGMTPGAYNMTIMVRRAGTSAAYDSYVQTNPFWVKSTTQANGSLPQVKMITQPAAKYKKGSTIAFTVAAPNYPGKVQYRVILYNWATRETTELWPGYPGYYYTGWQPGGRTNFPIHWPSSKMAAGSYTLTVLVRRSGTGGYFDSYVKTSTFQIVN